jgi:hypothetical protein
MNDKFHRVVMATHDAEQRLADLDVDDEDVQSLLSVIRIDLDEIGRDIDRIGELGKKLKQIASGDDWLRQQLDGLKGAA